MQACAQLQSYDVTGVRDTTDSSHNQHAVRDGCRLLTNNKEEGGAGLSSTQTCSSATEHLNLLRVYRSKIRRVAQKMHAIMASATNHSIKKVK